MFRGNLKGSSRGSSTSATSLIFCRPTLRMSTRDFMMLVTRLRRPIAVVFRSLCAARLSSFQPMQDVRLSDQQVEFYRENGYVIVEDILTGKFCYHVIGRSLRVQALTLT